MIVQFSGQSTSSVWDYQMELVPATWGREVKRGNVCDALSTGGQYWMQSKLPIAMVFTRGKGDGENRSNSLRHVEV